MKKVTEMTNFLPCWAVAATAWVLASAPNASFAEDHSPKQPLKSLFSISGQVVDALDGYYVIRSEGGRTKIRFLGWPRDLPGNRPVLGVGDDVTAVGWLGPDTLTVGGTLDVEGVYVEDRRAYFAISEFASGDFAPILLPSSGFGPVDGRASITGVISEIGDGALTLRAGDVQISVETSALNYDPFDAIGSQMLSLGDTVTVGGVLERNAEDGPQLRADRVTSIFVLSTAM